jgi:hypothetical protein
MKRIRMEVCPAGPRAPNNWKVTVDGTAKHWWDRQSQAIRYAVAMAHCFAHEGEIVTLKIKRPDGTIREERTYPRSSDPRRKKG